MFYHSSITLNQKKNPTKNPSNQNPNALPTSTTFPWKYHHKLRSRALSKNKNLSQRCTNSDRLEPTKQGQN